MQVTTAHMMRAYAMGIFPMAEARDSADLHWIAPLRRGVVPLDGLHISRSLARKIRRGRYHARVDTAFAAVVAACAARPETWISHQLEVLYNALHAEGHAHSQEIWIEDRLVGGVFGVGLGKAFFGESMFSTATDASKLALAHLVDRLRTGGFELFDTQFLTTHLASLGAIEITQEEYLRRLAEALEGSARFDVSGMATS